MPSFSILWFSGTGNALLAARTLAERFRAAMHTCPEAAIDLYGAIKGGRPQYLAPEIRVGDLRSQEGDCQFLHK